MKSIVYTETGATSVLRLVERKIPEPGPGEVRVRIIVSGVNPTDWKHRSAPDGPATEVVPHYDGGGVIDAVGPSVTEHAVGDRVWTCLVGVSQPSGTAQEFTVIPAWAAAHLPDAASFDVGAALGIPAVTAHRALTVAEHGPRRLKPGAMAGLTVLVAGGAGAVGHAAIQLARWAGATVITTVSGPEKAELVTKAGAHHVVNYRKDDAAAAIRAVAPEGVDIIAEVAPAANLPLDLAVLKNEGVVAVYARDGGETFALQVGPNMNLNTRIQFLLLYTVSPAALSAAAEDITAALADGALPVGAEHGLPLVRFPLAATADAHTAVENGVIGKVLVDVHPQ